MFKVKVKHENKKLITIHNWYKSWVYLYKCFFWYTSIHAIVLLNVHFSPLSIEQKNYFLMVRVIFDSEQKNKNKPYLNIIGLDE